MIFLTLFIFSFFNFFYSKIITFSFHRYYPVIQSSLDEFQNLNYRNYIGIELEAGTPRQKVILNIIFEEYATALFGEHIETSQNISRFKESSSTTYLPIDKEILYYFTSDAYFKGIRGYESFYFGNNQSANFTFVLSSKMKQIEVNHGIIGFSIVKNDERMEGYSFIKQLKKNNLTESYAFTIKYKGEDEGELIIGGYPHEYDSKNYKKEHLRETYTKAYGYQSLKWGLDFENVTYGEELLSDPNELDVSYFFIDYGYIISPYSFMKMIKESFFDIYAKQGICNKTLVRDKYESFICKKTEDFNITAFKGLNFFHTELNHTFSFTYNDLFYESGNIYYFLIISDEKEKDVRWIFGKPFFKKYQIIFNFDSKQIGFYFNKIKASKFNWSFFWNIILSMTIFGLILCIIYLVFSKVQQRKKIAIELIEDRFSSIEDETS